MTNKKSLTNPTSTKTSNKYMKKMGILASGLVASILIVEPAFALDVDALIKPIASTIVTGIDKWKGVVIGAGGAYQCVWGIGNDARERTKIGVIGAVGAYLGIEGLIGAMAKGAIA